MGEEFESFLAGIESIASNAVQKARFDSTIQAVILSCEDPTIGKYKCRYQDSIIYAYSNNVNNTYVKGSLVDIVVPNNDFSQDKIIRGTVTKLGINYISTAPEENYYDLIGVNCVTTQNNVYYLNTNIADYKYKIYQYSVNSENISFISTLEDYIRQSSSLLIAAKIKTSIQVENQYRGHYGISYTLKFKDNNSLNEISRVYTLDEDGMSGNPYRMPNKTRQYKLFDIDGSNFIRIESIQIFNKDFPNTGNENIKGLLTSGDIEISDLEFFGAVRMTENEINGVGISFYTPQGTFFTKDDNIDSYRTITAQIKVKGRIATALDKIPFYWGINNVTVSPKSPYYNKYLGRGWRCLNDSNIIQGNNENPNVVEWIPSSDTYIMRCSQATAKDNCLKVAIIYDNSVITKEINIRNLGNNIQTITIQSDGGTEFYYDMGHPNLVCKINGEDEQIKAANENRQSKYKYYWSYESDTGVVEDLTNEDPNFTIQLQYEDDFEKYETLQTSINKGSVLQNTKVKDSEGKELNLQEWENRIKSYDYIQRIYKNKIYDVQINRITSFGTFKCSVFKIVNDKEVYIGTAAITLYNKLEGEGTYSLVINNGTVVYQYDEMGNAPTTLQGSLSPQQIKTLSFTLYNNLGQAIESTDILKDPQCEVIWGIPTDHTLLKLNSNNSLFKSQEQQQQYEYDENNYHYYKNLEFLMYDIASRYDINRTNNQITLTVNYKGTLFTAKTNFTFVKQGDSGTNGTDYIVKIIPNTAMTNPPLIPIITIRLIDLSKKTYEYSTNFGYQSKQMQSNRLDLQNGIQLLKAQLWNNGEQVKINNNNIKWEILLNPDNKYQTEKNEYKSCQSSFIVSSDGGFKYNVNKTSNQPFNIIKCTIQHEGKSYYGTLPIVTIQINDDNYKINLKENSGFYYVLYTTDGVNPQYNKNSPFEIICQQWINEEWVDVSTVKTQNNEINYTATILPNQKKLLQYKQNEKQKNQFDLIPSKNFDGYDSNIAVVFTLKQGTNLIGTIHVPIHFLLNKYGLANLNDWDGNSIKIDDAGGYILSPQMGAGSKGTGNTFTGVLMGEVKQSGKDNSQTGLFGYSKGERTFFLDSKTGGALFGKNNGGRIIIDPTNKQALIYSGNFWENYNKETNFPSTYTYRDSNYKPSGNAKKDEKTGKITGDGMLINLTEPEIFFGKGYFYVNKDGFMHAAGGGDIAGWKIGNDEFGNGELTGGQIHLNKSGKIYSRKHDELNKKESGFYLGGDGLAIGEKFVATNSGALRLGTDAWKGNEDLDKDANKRKYWIINGKEDGNSYIAGPGNKVYLGTDKISLGTYSSPNFKVTKEGELTSKSGTIGGWKITSSSLIGGNDRLTLKSDGSMYGPTAHKGQPNESYTWSISNTGQAAFTRIISLSGNLSSGDSLTGSGFQFTGVGGTSSIGSNGVGGSVGGMSFAPSGISIAGTSMNLNNYIEHLAVGQIDAKIGKFDDAFIKNKLSYGGYRISFQPVVQQIWMNGRTTIQWSRIHALVSSEAGSSGSIDLSILPKN